MIVKVTVKPNAQQAGVERRDGWLIASVAAPPRDGRANEALIELLAAHFGVKQRAIRILCGAASRAKIVEIVQE